ncbi:uncharacterized protein LOC133205709 isoform X2 [Saccostrea echinata]|uniref:uncharacterized protein LOC133205709 isoform X2 n=1 Tax=Saccostrea echinata TaxID=191078 RepID=UPI002A8021E9|nr:uncharacterized protein LOC133205709 isoform X2 [Saccostrea echinata]
MPTNFDTYPESNVEEILPVLNDDLLDILQMGQNDLTSHQVDQGVYVNKRKIQFPRLGRKRSLTDSKGRIREYAEKMIKSADAQVDRNVLRKLKDLLNTDSDNQADEVIII